MAVDKALVGKRVALGAGVRHKEYAGLAGVIKKAVKSRNVYTIALDDGRYYDAAPENVEVK